MKNLVFIIMALMPFPQAFAKGEQVIAEISMKNNSNLHRYILVQEAGK